jgi:hypothetical protein
MPEHAERPGLMNSLYARLALGLVALVMLLGAVNLAIMLHAGRLYQQELNQQLNRKLAANLIAENKLQVEEGRFDPGALESIFHTCWTPPVASSPSRRLPKKSNATTSTSLPFTPFWTPARVCPSSETIRATGQGARYFPPRP